jgi:hypothetical protein
MNESPRQPSSPKKPYARPVVTEYGFLKDIVQGSTGSMSDGAAGDTKACWIAEALYGEHDPRTFLLRRWMTGIYDARGRGWQFVAFYRRTGPVVARAIRATPVLGRGFRVVFDALLGKALRDLIVAKP